MGIHQFFKIRYGGDAKDPKIIKHLGDKLPKLDSLSGLAIAIDAYPIIHAAVRGMPQVDTLTHGEQEKITSHINVIFFNAVMFHKLGIKQLWVFDGGPPTIKICELKKRKDAREKAKKEAASCKDAERVKKLEKRSYELESYIIDDVKKLLTLMGVEWATAPEEAEAYCAYLNKKGRYDYVLSPDSDALVFGAKNLIRPYKEDKKKVFYVYARKTILKKLKLDAVQFIEMSVCMGCDFADKVPGIGPATVIKKAAAGTIHFNQSQKDAIEYYKTALKQDGYKKVKIISKGINEPKLRKFFKHNGFTLSRLEIHIDFLKE